MKTFLCLELVASFIARRHKLRLYQQLVCISCFPSLGRRWLPVAGFLVLGTGCMFSRTWRGCTSFGSSTHVTLKACSMRVYTLVISRRVEHVYISFVLLYNFCLTIFFYLESLEERFFGQDYCCTHECFYKPPECFTNLRILSSVSGRICHSCDCLFL